MVYLRRGDRGTCLGVQLFIVSYDSANKQKHYKKPFTKQNQLVNIRANEDAMAQSLINVNQWFLTFSPSHPPKVNFLSLVPPLF